MKKKVITIDQSFTHTAYVVWGHKDEIEKHGVLCSPKSLSYYERAKYIANNLTTIINTNNIGTVVIEQLAFGGQGTASKNLAGLLFVIVVLVCQDTELREEDFHFVMPTSAKKSHTGNGRATKQDMVAHLPKEVLELFSQNFKKTTGLYDLADAYSFYGWYKNKIKECNI